MDSAVVIQVGLAATVACSVLQLTRRSLFMRGLLRSGMAESKHAFMKLQSQGSLQLDTVHATLWSMVGAEEDTVLQQHVHLSHVAHYWHAVSGTNAAAVSGCAVCMYAPREPHCADLCLACATSCVPLKQWDTALPPAWWSRHASAAAEFAVVHGTPAIIAHMANLVLTRTLPPTADAVHFAELLGGHALLTYLQSAFDASGRVRPGAEHLLTVALQTAAPANPTDVWAQVLRFNDDIHTVHWLQCNAGLVDVSVFGTHLVDTVHTVYTGRKRPREGEREAVARAVTVGDSLHMPLLTDADTVLQRLCDAYPLLGSPAQLTQFLCQHPNVVVAGGAVAYAVSVHEVRNAQPGADVDVWVLDPPTTYCATYADRVDAEVRMGSTVVTTPSAVAACDGMVALALTTVGSQPLYVTARTGVATLHTRDRRPLQIVHTQASSLSHLLWAFDLPHVQVGLRYSHTVERVVVEASIDFCRTMQLGSLLWWKQLKSTPLRLAKAFARGFGTDTMTMWECAAAPDSVAATLHRMREHNVQDAQPAVELAILMLKTGATEAYVVNSADERYTDVEARWERIVAVHPSDLWRKRLWLRTWSHAMAPGGFTQGYHSLPPLASEYTVRAHVGTMYVPLTRVTWEHAPTCEYNPSVQAWEWHGTLQVVEASDDLRDLCARTRETATRLGGNDKEATDTAQNTALVMSMSAPVHLAKGSIVSDGVWHTTMYSCPSGNCALARMQVESVCEVGLDGCIVKAGVYVARVWFYPLNYLATPADA